MEQIKTSSSTIVALATPHSKGAIAMVRLSGPEALTIADKIWKGKLLSEALTHTAHLGYIINNKTDNEIIDQALATVFKAPATFTGEDMVEFGLHGSMLIARQTITALVDAGAKPAGPGEFSQRAVANGRMNLLSAEAAADLVAATSKAAKRIAMSQMRGGVDQRLNEMQEQLLHLASLLELELDFSEEDVEFAPRTQLLELALSIRAHLERLQSSYRTGSAIKQGIPVAIIGPTNAGKSSLLNLLADDERAIVSDIHGTTRDIVEDNIEIGQYMFRFMDTAGLRDTDDPIEQIGIAHSHRALSKARIVLLVSDATTPLSDKLIREAMATMSPDSTLILLNNKIDRLEPSSQPDVYPQSQHLPDNRDILTLNISAKTGEGIDRLKDSLCTIIMNDEQSEGDILLTNERHHACVTQALASLARVISQLRPQPTYPDSYSSLCLPPTPDIIAQGVREVISHLSDLTGQSLQTPAILQNIFSHFCIGK
ncbi:MAG: tRNA uridine-5-carboxymethylaminomethyl(34) synthesis GTPase MnmE [Muribaculaceae bacterium]|nr:tRNA uridine-5-carboxymethylaminomethyl(34) synthesis GTPase MnmE [Muribaculaceae bacterium]